MLLVATAAQATTVPTCLASVHPAGPVAAHRAGPPGQTCTVRKVVLLESTQLTWPLFEKEESLATASSLPPCRPASASVWLASLAASSAPADLVCAAPVSAMAAAEGLLH